MYIRPAQPSDLAVPVLMLLAMEDIIYKFIGSRSQQQAIEFLTGFFQDTDNQYSYTNTFVAIDENDKIAGSVTAYDGDRLDELRAPVLAAVTQHYNQQIDFEKETLGGELYLDTVAVAPDQQGKGVGSALIRYIIDYAKEQQFDKVGLLVDLSNPNAQRLYERIGFQLGDKRPFIGGDYYHMFYPVK